MTEQKGVVADITGDRFSESGWEKVSLYAPAEAAITLFVNGLELVTMLCTPDKLNCLTLGYLYAEGIIADPDDITMMRVCDAEAEIDVRLKASDFKLPAKRVLTSGCGGGVTFRTEGQEVNSDFRAEPQEVLALIRQMQEQTAMYRLSGGMHASALADREKVLVLAEDIGRHNTMDKVLGECLMRRLPTRDRLLLTTGRISTEMLLKAARMQTPVVVSLTSPTARAVTLAQELGVTLVGYARGRRLTVYSRPDRLGRV